MKVLVLGATGMLGHKLVQELSRSFEVSGTIRGKQTDAYHHVFTSQRMISRVDAHNFSSLRDAVENIQPDVVVNAIGAVKQVAAAKEPAEAIEINALLPHKLAGLGREYHFRLITIGTDCVFRGDKGNYRESDAPDAADLYGLTKRLGEVDEPPALTLRTSMIGRELTTSHGLLEWFLSNRGSRVKGFLKAKFSGLTTIQLSRLIKKIISDHTDLTGLYHVSADSISKYDLLTMLNESLDAKVIVEPSDDLIIDRSLDSSRFRSATGWAPVSWREMIDELVLDNPFYQVLRREH